MPKAKADLNVCIGMMDELGDLVPHEVHTEPQIWLVGQIRNASRDGFSNDTTTVVTREAQLAWWAEQGDQLRAWLFIPSSHLTPVGFGLLRPIENGQRLATVVAVSPEARGHDYGLAITRYIVHMAWLPCWATARIDNPAAIRLHDPGHWKSVPSPEPDRLLAFETRSDLGASA